MIGRVTAKKTEKTITVIVERRSKHPLYKKAFLRSKKYLVDDPIGVKEGDIVEIMKVAPVSKMKHFRVVKILGQQMEEITDAKLKEQAKEVIKEVLPAGRQVMPEEKEEKVEQLTSESVNQEKEAKPKRKKGKKNGSA